MIDELAESENASEVQCDKGDVGHVKGVEGIAVVHQSLVLERCNGKTFLLVTGKNDCNGPLEDE